MTLSAGLPCVRGSTGAFLTSLFSHSSPFPLVAPFTLDHVKKSDEKDNVSNCIQLKTSVIKGIKSQLIEQFSGIELWLNQIMLKKDPVRIV